MIAASKRIRGLLPLAALLAAVGLLVVASRPAEVMQAVELKTLDWRFRHLSVAARHDPRIVLVTVDQASLDHFENEGMYWPWPRGIYEGVLRFLKAGGAKVVVFDVLFTSPSPSGAAEDAILGKALKEFGATAMAIETGPEPHATRSAPPDERFAAAAGPALAASAQERRSARLPVPEVSAGSRLLGDTKVDPDLDGIFRRVPLLFKMGGRLYLTLPAAAAMLATGRTLDELAPKLTDGRMLVRYHGKAHTSDMALKTYDVYPIGDVLLSWQAIEDKRQPALDPSVFKDKIVFISMSAAGLLDNRPSPMSPVFPGTEIVATAADNLINGDFLTRAGFAAVLAMVLAAIMLAGFASRLSSHAWSALAVVLSSSALLAGVSCFLFTRGAGTGG